ncbi:MAG: hypothetical protein A2992_03175 [Elusimicrobia bacterium RIFCSPLOWO2_01_FULL_59_12]|nr:MAG: hypothetical protein A2992_03175 [Elusimicrobia bacterium RIFCSPLOWO2_01_FULL_59_12]
MTHLSISQARGQLTRLAKSLKAEGQPVEITNRGEPVLALLPWDLYEAMEETIEVLSDEPLMKQLKKSIQEMKKGKLVSLEHVKRKLRLQ